MPDRPTCGPDGRREQGPLSVRHRGGGVLVAAVTHHAYSPPLRALVWLTDGCGNAIPVM